MDLAWNWNSGAPTPSRLIAEFIRAWDTMHWQEREREEEQGRELKVWKGAMDTLGKPLVRAAELESLSDGGSLRRMEYFAWVWDTQREEVTVATRDDDAEANRALWAVGGSGAGMESAREVLRNFMFGWWRRRLCKEAVQWLKSPWAQIEIDENRNAIRDCITRCANSTWWDWSDGSRLLFWRWPEAWRQEARDGARGHHMSYPEPRKYSGRTPPQEQWVVKKDLKKIGETR